MFRTDASVTSQFLLHSKLKLPFQDLHSAPSRLCVHVGRIRPTYVHRGEQLTTDKHQMKK